MRLFQLRMLHTAGRKIPTRILKISTHSFKSHSFNQVLKITVHLNCLLLLLIPKQGEKTYPKQSQISPAHTSARTRSQESTYLWNSLVLWTPSASCQLRFSQVQGAAGIAQRGTVLCRHRATLGCQLSWPCYHSCTLWDIRGSNQRNEATCLDFFVGTSTQEEGKKPTLNGCLP